MFTLQDTFKLIDGSQGTGKILADDYNDILGKKAAKDIEDDTHLNWDDIEQ